MNRYNSSSSRYGLGMNQYEKQQSMKLCMKQKELECQNKKCEEVCIKHEDIYQEKKEVIDDVNPQKISKEVNLENCKLKHVVNALISKDKLDKILNKKKW